MTDPMRENSSVGVGRSVRRIVILPCMVFGNDLMKMENFALLDDGKQASLRDDLSLPEIYKTRLVRVDLES